MFEEYVPSPRRRALPGGPGGGRRPERSHDVPRRPRPLPWDALPPGGAQPGWSRDHRHRRPVPAAHLLHGRGVGRVCSGPPTAARAGSPSPTGRCPSGSSGSVAVADSDPNVIYYGTGSDGMRSNVSTGRGVYKSTDGGKTWSFAGLRDVGQIGEVRIHPVGPEHGVGRGHRRRVQAQPRPRHLQDHRRRQDLAEHALRVRQHRRHGRGDPARQPQRGLRLDEPRGAEALDHHQRLPRGRLLQEHRRGRALPEDHQRPAPRISSARPTWR